MGFNVVRFSRRWLKFLPDSRRLELYPPWWLMRIKVLVLENEWRHIRIRLPLTWISRNMGGSMFGGFQASLADPIAPLACSKVFPEYHVWTRHLSVDFVRPALLTWNCVLISHPKKKRKSGRNWHDADAAPRASSMACMTATGGCAPR